MTYYLNYTKNECTAIYIYILHTFFYVIVYYDIL